MQDNLIKRIALGTVQFGLDYGVSNKNGKVSKIKAYEILSYANRVGIDTLDTALVYGDSEKIIGQFLTQKSNQYNVVSKFNIQRGYVKEDVRKKIGKTLENLKQESLYGYLNHSFSNYTDNSDVWTNLEKLKDEGLIQKIGFSLYDLDELQMIFDKKIPIDIVQIPFSVFDKRFEGELPRLKSRGVEIHVRSIFLQGLAFLTMDQLSGKLIDAKPNILLLEKVSKKYNISKASICLNYVLSNENIDKVVIGVDSIDQLKENIDNLKDFHKLLALEDDLKKIQIDDEDILLPYRWKKN